jgi:hypothetical protein
MLRAKAMMAPLSKDFRVLAKTTTRATISSVSATNVTIIEPPVIESTQRHNRASDPA